MYNEHFGFSEAPFNITPDSRFFFVNPCYEEAFATVRYGIDARKGFIVVTGEAGTGKTTVLKRLVNSLDPNVYAACVFDPHVSFLELLRGMLADFGITPIAADRLSMMGQLYDFLIGQLEKGQAVTLMVDEAQSVSVSMLEELRLLSNLETDTDKLIQIILVGQPGLVEKLDRPELVQLKQRVALRCRIRPLEEHEVGLYIEARLKTIHFHGRDLFNGECIKRIADCSKGIPRLINVICDNALLIACVAGRRWVSADDIVEAAKELQLIDPKELQRGAQIRPTAQTAATPVEGPIWERRPSLSDKAPQFEPMILDLGVGTDRRPARRAARTLSFTGMMTLLLLAGTVWFFAANQRTSLLPAVLMYFENWTGFNRASDRGPSATPTRTPSAGEISPTIPPQQPAPLTETLNDEVGAVSARDRDTASASDRKDSLPEKPPSEVTADKRVVIKPHGPARAFRDRAATDQTLEIEIYRAIHDRAILGVQVSWVNEGTVYLEGRVASRRQKLAAVRATLSVPGVKEVRDRIVID